MVVLHLLTGVAGMEVGVATVYLQLFILLYILSVYTPTDNK